MVERGCRSGGEEGSPTHDRFRPSQTQQLWLRHEDKHVSSPCDMSGGAVHHSGRRLFKWQLVNNSRAPGGLETATHRGTLPLRRPGEALPLARSNILEEHQQKNKRAGWIRLTWPPQAGQRMKNSTTPRTHNFTKHTLIQRTRARVQRDAPEPPHDALQGSRPKLHINKTMIYWISFKRNSDEWSH